MPGFVVSLSLLFQFQGRNQNNFVKDATIHNVLLFFCGRLPPFGHGYTQKDSRLEIFALIFAMFGMIACFIDWTLLEKKYGYRTPKIIQLVFRVSFLFTQM